MDATSQTRRWKWVSKQPLDTKVPIQVLDWPQLFAGLADSPRQSIGRELFLHDELLERGHDPLAVVDRQTNFARREPFKPFLDLHLRPLDFAKFVGSLDRHRPFHRRLPQVGDFHETVLVKVSYSPSPQSFCRSPAFCLALSTIPLPNRRILTIK